MKTLSAGTKRKPSRVALGVVGIAALLCVGLFSYASASSSGSAVSDIPIYSLVYDYSYDDAGRLLTKTTSLADDGREMEREEYVWNGDGTLSERALYYDGNDDGDWQELDSYEYDDNGRLVSKELRYHGNAEKLYGKALYEYNDLPGGGVERISRNGLAKDDDPDAADSYTREVYDAEGYLLSSEDVVGDKVVAKSTYERETAPKMADVASNNGVPATSYDSATGTSRSNVLELGSDGEVTSVTLVEEGASPVVRELNSYDGDGKLVRTEYPAQGAVPGYVRYSLYDDEGRLTREVLEPSK